MAETFVFALAALTVEGIVLIVTGALVGAALGSASKRWLVRRRAERRTGR